MEARRDCGFEGLRHRRHLEVGFEVDRRYTVAADVVVADMIVVVGSCCKRVVVVPRLRIEARSLGRMGEKLHFETDGEGVLRVVGVRGERGGLRRRREEDLEVGDRT